MDQAAIEHQMECMRAEQIKLTAREIDINRLNNQLGRKMRESAELEIEARRLMALAQGMMKEAQEKLALAEQRVAVQWNPGAFAAVSGPAHDPVGMSLAVANQRG
jgi:hypothetical protein